jgi:hypothetical protein
MRPGGASRQWHAAADNGVGPQHTSLAPPQVHGSTTSAAISWRKPHDLGKSATQNRARAAVNIGARRPVFARRLVVQRFGEKLMMSSMRAIDLIGRAKGRHGADGAPFLTD